MCSSDLGRHQPQLDLPLSQLEVRHHLVLEAVLYHQLYPQYLVAHLSLEEELSLLCRTQEGVTIHPPAQYHTPPAQVLTLQSQDLILHTAEEEVLEVTHNQELGERQLLTEDIQVIHKLLYRYVYYKTMLYNVCLNLKKRLYIASRRAVLASNLPLILGIVRNWRIRLSLQYVFGLMTFIHLFY